MLREAGYKVVECWECEMPKWMQRKKLPEKRQENFPHFIFFDFEAYSDTNHKKRITNFLEIKNKHEPVSFSIGDSLKKEPTHICNKDPKKLLESFMEEIKKKS